MNNSLIATLIYLAPLCSLFLLSALGFTQLRFRERIVTRILAYGQTISFVCAMYLGIVMLNEYWSSGNWLTFHVLHHHLFSFGHHDVKLLLQLDGISVPFVIMATTLSNIVGVFSQHYLHRDIGFFRFFFLINLFLVGVLTVFLAANFQDIFIGWELMGITSALLISFFTMRNETIDNALHAFWAYRVTDVGLLLGSVLLASYLPHADFGGGDLRHLSGALSYTIPLLFLLSAMGKSAQFPFSSWLPRAMEGPTSSSAIFYGGLSIHAGVYLLLRLRMEVDLPIAVLIVIGCIGLISCTYGALLSQVQSDVKSGLAYASLSQVGIMFVEIALGWYQIVLLHCMGHAFLRTYQILKCSSIMHQFVEFADTHQHTLEQSRVSMLALLFPTKGVGRVFSFAFDLALRAAAGASTAVVVLERIAHTLQDFENRWVSRVTGITESRKER